MDFLHILNKFDQFLDANKYSFSGIIIGGAALNILNVTDRVTKDIDFLDPQLDKKLINLSIDFKDKYPNLNLHSEWINNGPYNLQKDLPQGWVKRVRPIFIGKSITLFTLGRQDFVMSKLYAYCDRDIDLDDCIKLKPTDEEIELAINWLIDRDSNEHWPERVKEQIEYLKGRL